ncbi:MAG: hypothetical protein BMS9Abin26_0458 [Gammaproteobacteria bacterium]|nr:MAG: hypothetical protein BMS9Abin26_0458 [Gammaproteobacteria bacterium]
MNTPQTSNSPDGAFRLTWKLVILLGLLGMAVAAKASATEFTVADVSTELKGQRYYLNADVIYEFNEEVLEAMRNGVPLGIRLAISLKRVRDYLWNESVIQISQYHEIHYNALTEQYIVKDVLAGTQQSYISRAAAITAVGRFQNIPLIESGKISASEKYQISFQPAFDIESLPAPLRPWAWLSSDWKFSGERQQWPLQK